MSKWVALLLVSVLLAGACARREQAGPEQARRARDGAEVPGREADGPSPEGEVLPTREITLQRQSQPTPEAEPAAAAQAPVTPAGPAAALLPLRGPALLPEDFRVGPLEDRLAPGGAELQILRVARGFLDGLGAGEFPEQAVLPEKREELRQSLSYYLEEGLVPTRYRLGAIYFEEEAQEPQSAWLNLRLYGSPGVAEGELYVSAADGKWYVADIQAGFPSLREPYAHDAEKFIPSVYGWRLQ